MSIEITLNPYETKCKEFREHPKKGDVAVKIAFEFTKRYPSEFYSENGVLVSSNHHNKGEFIMNLFSEGKPVFPTHIVIATFRFREKLEKMGIDSGYNVSLVATHEKYKVVHDIRVNKVSSAYVCGEEIFYFASWTKKSDVKWWIDNQVRNHSTINSLLEEAQNRLFLDPVAIENSTHWVYKWLRERYPHMK